MFEALAGKVVSGVISLSMMLFSSYEGNQPYFSQMAVSLVENRIFIKTELVNAFDNDFEDIFRSGKQIDIFFNITLKTDSNIISEDDFKHTVIYDPLSDSFTLIIEELDEIIIIDSYRQLLKNIAKIEYTCNIDSAENVIIEIESYLSKIKFDSFGKKYDLMILWNLKKPKAKVTYGKDHEI